VAEFNALMNDLRIVPPIEPNALLRTPTQADAWSQVGDWVQQQRAISAERGLWNDETGLPTQAGALDAARQASMNLLMGSTAPGFRAYHASPHDFPPTPRNPHGEFDASKIGTGVGAQPYGQGHYLAGNEDVARIYRGQSGHMYEANVKAEPHELIDWDQPFAAQGDVGKTAHEITRDLLTKVYQKSGYPAEFAERLMNTGGGLGRPFSPDMTPGDAILWAQAAGVDPAVVSQALRSAGIPGLKYSDAAVAGGPANQNYVIFDADTIEILRKYGLAGLMLGGGAAAAGSQQPQ
jgi:hypothetical protein